MADRDFAATPVVPLDAEQTAILSQLESAYALPAYQDEKDDRTGPQLVVVAVHLPHVVEYGLPDPNLELVYRWPGGALGPINEGDLVLCPGTRLHPKEWTGIVTSLDASNHPYSGYVRNLLGRVSG